ncbi:hypothetical protein V4C53_30160 [Paraburkholderia azotifigens]|uniref:hypothetical protein n=1 Tax=Paraburkholderia azotifigens TaxID=2057004 RepID=UPI0031740CE7
MGFPTIQDSRFSRENWAKEFFGEAEMASASRRGGKPHEESTKQREKGPDWSNGFSARHGSRANTDE